MWKCLVEGQEWEKVWIRNHAIDKMKPMSPIRLYRVACRAAVLASGLPYHQPIKRNDRTPSPSQKVNGVFNWHGWDPNSKPGGVCLGLRYILEAEQLNPLRNHWQRESQDWLLGYELGQRVALSVMEVEKEKTREMPRVWLEPMKLEMSVNLAMCRCQVTRWVFGSSAYERS